MSSVSVVTNALRLRGFRRPTSAAEILHPPLGARVREAGYLAGIALVALVIGVVALLLARPEHNGGAMAMDAGASDHAATLATGAAATPVPGTATVNVSLGEYVVGLDTVRVPAGPVRLVVRTTGSRGHELQIYPAGAATGGGHGMEQGAGGVMPGAAGILRVVPAGETLVLDVNLPAGAWELGCHLTDAEGGTTFDHYERGMKATLTVE